MQQITTAKDIKKLGSILSVWAHPDDETYLAAGVIACAIENGQRTACITATHGEAGNSYSKKWSLNELGTVREQELKAALHCLGCAHFELLSYKDGHCKDVPLEEGRDIILQRIKTFQPDTIITFGVDGWTGHDDHRAVSGWVTEALSSFENSIRLLHVVTTEEHYVEYLESADQEFDIFFNIEKPPFFDRQLCDVYFQLTPNLVDKKFAALSAMPSQTEVMLTKYGKSWVDQAFGLEAFVSPI